MEQVAVLHEEVAVEDKPTAKPLHEEVAVEDKPTAKPWEAGRSCQRQRFMGTDKELRSGKGFAGRVRMICVALNYEGTESPLGCVVDSERISTAAARSGVKDIVKLYDNGSTPRFPCKAELADAIGEVGSRCEANDYLVFCYSGHGDSEDNEAAPSGKDCMLCLRSRDGEDERMVDDELARLLTTSLHPQVRVLVLVDACHSGGICDMDTPGLWEGRRACVISGCTENQLSTDSGDGGVMTNALLQVMKRKKVRARRRQRDLSVQFVFNRMVDAMPEDEDDEDEDEDEDDEWEDDEEWDSEEGSSDDEDEEDSSEEEEEPGQDITLSWPVGQDPSKITWPF